jgi:CBS domain-containing protein
LFGRSAGEALSLMASHRIRHLPVVRDNEVLGLISVRDVLEFRLESLEENFASLLRGMAPEQIAKVAQPFYRSAGLTTRSGGGIGLALAGAMIRAHQGALAIESRLGIGTTATLHFPPPPVMAHHAEAAD